MTLKSTASSNRLISTASSGRLSIDTSNDNPIFSLDMSSGLSNLDASLEINGTTVTPSFRYKGEDADHTVWVAWGHGEDLGYVAATGATILNEGSPVADTDSTSIGFDGLANYVDGAQANGNVTTEDFIVELVIQWSAKNSSRVISKRATSSTEGWEIYFATGPDLRLTIEDSSANTALLASADLIEDAWYHVLFFADRSGSGSVYINGSLSAEAVLSGVGSLTSATSLKLGAASWSTSATYKLDKHVAYAAMWQQDSWLDTHLQADVAAERFAKLTGVYPEVAAGTATPTHSRASAAYLDKDESGVRRLYRVGDHWPRVCVRPDGASTITGYLSEYGKATYLLQSEDVSTTWSKEIAGDTFSLNGYEAPNGETTADGLIANSSVVDHGINQNITLVGVTYTLSVFARAGDQNWLHMHVETLANTTAYFNLASCSLGTMGSATSAYAIEDWGNGWCRCSMTFAGTAAAHDIVIHSAEADLDETFAGDAATVNTWVWGMQLETGNSMTSYQPTTTAAVNSAADLLTFVGDDGNLGGVGSNKQGSLFFDFRADGPSLAKTWIDFAVDASNKITVISDTGEGYMKSGQELSGSPTYCVDSSFDYADGLAHTHFYRWTETSIEQRVDGALDPPALTVTTDQPIALDTIAIGANLAGTEHCTGLIGNIRIRRR